VHVGRDVYIGEMSEVNLGCVCGADTILHPLSILPRSITTETGSIWAGSPGRQLTNDTSRLLTTLRSHRARINRAPESICFSLAVLCSLEAVTFLHGSAITFPPVLCYIYVPAFRTAIENMDVLSLLPWVPIITYIELAAALLVLLLVKRLCKVRSGTWPLQSTNYLKCLVASHVTYKLMHGITRGVVESVFMQPILFLLGCDVRRGAEVDACVLPTPDLTIIGEDSMINGGAVVGVPVVAFGQVTLERTVLGRRCFLGNMAVVPQGCTLGDNTLLGVASCCPDVIPADATYFGSPAFLIENRAHWQPVPKKGWFRSLRRRRHVSRQEPDYVGTGIATGASSHETSVYRPPAHLRMARGCMNVAKVGIVGLVMWLVLLLLVSAHSEMQEWKQQNRMEHWIALASYGAIGEGNPLGAAEDEKGATAQTREQQNTEKMQWLAEDKDGSSSTSLRRLTGEIGHSSSSSSSSSSSKASYLERWSKGAKAGFAKEWVQDNNDSDGSNNVTKTGKRTKKGMGTKKGERGEDKKMVKLELASFLIRLLLLLTFTPAVIALCIASKWLLVCRYTRGHKPMYSSFIWRMELVYELELLMRRAARIFDGTPLINVLHRAYGANIGKNVYQWEVNHFEYDLVTVKDDAILAGAIVQTHLYEDRMFKMGPVEIGTGALVVRGFTLYDSVVGPGASLASRSLVMRGERVSAHQRHFGLPSGAASVPSVRPEFSVELSPRPNLSHESREVAIKEAELQQLVKKATEMQRELSRAQVRLFDARNIRASRHTATSRERQGNATGHWWNRLFCSHHVTGTPDNGVTNLEAQPPQVEINVVTV